MTMTVPAFQAGDVVRLRSGGPLMTVIQVKPEQQDSYGNIQAGGSLWCRWFADAEVRNGWFGLAEVAPDRDRLARAMQANADALATMQDAAAGKEPFTPHPLSDEDFQP